MTGSEASWLGPEDTGGLIGLITPPPQNPESENHDTMVTALTAKKLLRF